MNHYSPCTMFPSKSCTHISEKAFANCTNKSRNTNSHLIKNLIADLDNVVSSAADYREDYLQSDSQYPLENVNQESSCVSLKPSTVFDSRSWFDQREPLTEVFCESPEQYQSFSQGIESGEEADFAKSPKLFDCANLPSKVNSQDGAESSSKLKFSYNSDRKRCFGSSAPLEERNGRFLPYPSPISSDDSLKNCRVSATRKRTSGMRTKYQKYEGLSNFSASPDLISEIVSFEDENPSSEKRKAKSLSTQKVRRNNPSDVKSETENVHDSVSAVKIDFLLHVDEKEWLERKKDLEKAVEQRKQVFIQGGFAETSGKAFEPNEQSIEKKPVPNRWVWYMRLSTDYDKMKGTKVPVGGPAGYLKYGWDRLGPIGKQPYQELADIYSAQRQKFMIENGIEEEVVKKSRSKTSEKNLGEAQQVSALEGEKEQDDLKFSSNNFLQPLQSVERPRTPPCPLESCSVRDENLKDFFFMHSNFPVEETQTSYESMKPALLGSPLFLKVTPEINGPTTMNIPFIPSYLQSPEFLTDFFTTMENQDLVFADPFIQERIEHGTPAGPLSSPNSSLSSTPRDFSSCQVQPTWSNGTQFSPVSQQPIFFDFSASLATPSDLASLSTPEINSFFSPVPFQAYQTIPRDQSIKSEKQV
ncbi:expressed protein [Phakopsora pachyrhizi]|uniref:Expressed protein n=1 Tax=Phakopsora pachyrhizi TaxID=170000 RepID=A0AAV0AI61_PHAPC|nr:expressed protein [Phakopsora pachyrhizi]